MCRIATYLGPSIPIENIVTGPEHSLLCQSRDAEESKVTLNGDGFGISWYGGSREPGLYRECLPAWSDENLLSICRMVNSHLFIAHVRASTIGETMRTNCHPFIHNQWSFAHNGQIGGFNQLKRGIEERLSDELYHSRRGTTDSELLFLLLLQNGFEGNPNTACSQTILELESMRVENNIADPLRLTFVISDGFRLFGVRYASDKFAPTLYQSSSLDNGGISLASEPLDGAAENWTLVQPSNLVEISGNNVLIHDLWNNPNNRSTG